MVDKGGGAGKTLSVQDWEQIMQDFRASAELQQKWLSIWPGLALVEQALLTILKKEIAIKAQLLVFIEENADILIGSEVHIGFGMILESLRGVLQSPSSDGVIISSVIKENMMVMATAVAIVTDALHSARERLEGLVHLFLVFINRPNHPSDRHIRGLACDCLRELEMAYPCILYGCVGHIHHLCLNEKSHANQSYTLLLTTIMENLSTRMYTGRSKSANYLPVLQNTSPLVAFSLPFFLVSSTPGREAQSLPKRDLTPGNLREFRTIVSFLLERPQLLTPMGMLEMVSSVIKIGKVIEISGPSLKAHFPYILHTYSPILCHIVLLIYTQFLDCWDGEEEPVLKRLVALARDDSQSLPFRLLGVHWLLGMETLHLRKQKASIIAPFASGLYPLVFDPLSLKAGKLGALAHCAIALDRQRQASSSSQEIVANGTRTSSEGNNTEDDNPTTVLLKEGLLSVSSYHWLPPWSTETQLAFHIFHRFLTVAVPHSSKADHSHQVAAGDSPLFQTLERIIVTTVAKMRKLVPNLVALLDRLMGCDVHRALGERLLRTCNEELLPQLRTDQPLSSYFPLLERIAESGEIPPSGLIDKITVYIRQRVEEDDRDDEEWVLWSRSTQVLGICRTILLHYQSSRVFHALAPLLGFLARFFPDIEVRDTARLYLRLLTSVPGNKLRSILQHGDEHVDESNAPQVSSLLRPSSPPSKGAQQSLPVASYVQLSRISPLLVRHSWSIILFQVGGGAQDNDRAAVKERRERNENEMTGEAGALLDNQGAEQDEVGMLPSTLSRPTLRVMDARTSEIIVILRRHFAEIPDYFNGPGLKVNVPCTLRYIGEYHQKFKDGIDSGDCTGFSTHPVPNVSDSWPAVYACVITLKTSGFYGPIPTIRVPFLLSEPPQKTRQRPGDGSSGNPNEDTEVQSSDQKGKGLFYLEDASHVEAAEDTKLVQLDTAGMGGLICDEVVVLQLEPKQPVPTLVDVHIEFNDEEGNGVEGQLNSIPVSIEDLFLQPPVPVDLFPVRRTDYLPQLFDALWEACGGPGRLGTETFSLRGALDAVTIRGSESVKLLEAQADRVVAAVEQYLAQFVVTVDGSPLATMAKDGGMFQDVKWLEGGTTPSTPSDVSGPLTNTGSQMITKGASSNEPSLQIQVRDPALGAMDDVRSGLGSFLVLILLPPRYHLLLRMEVADESTLVRIRTDHWPCLAHVDEYLEALTLS